MNEWFMNQWQKMASYVMGLSLKQKIGLAGSIVLLVIGMAAVSIWANQDPYQVLFADLQPEDAKAVAKRLGEQNISLQWDHNQTTILVPKSKVDVARIELAKVGLPGQDVVGFEKFDSASLGMSSYVQKIQYVRAIQGELTRSIQRISSVKHARVHISLPPKKTFLEEEEPPKASVVLELHPGQQPSKAEIKGMAHLVASAVEGLKVSQVTIVDNQGNFLHQPDEDSHTALSASLLEMQRQIEKDYEKRIIELLVPIVGLGKVKSKVTVDMDTSRTNTMEETYDPNKVVAKSILKNDEVSQGQRPNPIGIPGSRSNLPGTEGQNPPLPMASTTNEKNTQQTNYAIPKKVQTTDKPSGNIKRLTVAVLVDGYYSEGEGGKTPTFSPRPEEELKRIQDVVANAVGFDAERRDSITVSSMPFKNQDLALEAPAVKPETLTYLDVLKQAIKPSLISLGLLLFAFLVLRPMMRNQIVPALEEQFQSFPKTVQELEQAQNREGILALNSPILIDDFEPIEKKQEEELRKKIADKLSSVPKKGIRIVQEWLEQDSEQQAA